MSGSATLLFPPAWYYAAVPADLTATAGVLRARGLPVRCFDLNAAFHARLLSPCDGFAALREVGTYRNDILHVSAATLVQLRCREVGEAFGVTLTPRTLELGVDPSHVPPSRAAALDRLRNPALPVLEAAVVDVMMSPPSVVAVALVHPEQRPHVVALGALLRDAGFRGRLVVYGSLEDVLAPADLADDLLGEPRHVLFEHYDGAILGEAESALVALALDGAMASVPNLLWRERPSARPLRHVERAEELSAPSFDGIEPGHYPFPWPIVDLRLGRGCPWARCHFCSIHAHHPVYRAASVDTVAEAMVIANRRLGARFFRLRDDLVTSTQLAALAARLSQLPFRPRWSCRLRFEPTLDESVLRAAAESGLEEIWLGLESPVDRVRGLMNKGGRQGDVGRISTAAERVGVRARLLCMVGYPGELPEERAQTLALLRERLESSPAGVSLTPFRVTRSSAIARDPSAFGIELLPETLARHERLRAHLPYAGEEALRGSVDRMIQELAPVLAAHPSTRFGPDPSHGWLHASLSRRA